ncbi:MAG TPA: TIGR01777 family oxidoreductase [Gemmatimonadales bacterium]|nr:TIGR01777 family oxidoreductase [Gemmatimonadales bacterium]
MPTFEFGSTFDASPEAARAWYARAGGVERLAPPWEAVEVEEQAGALAEGGAVTLRVGSGPLAHRWHLTSRFELAGPGRTRLLDLVEYQPPLGALGAAADALHFRDRVRRALRYRHATLAEDLAAHRRANLPPMVVAISGASGLLGTALSRFLSSGGHAVRRIVRRRARPGEIAWDPAAGTLDRAGLEGVDAVVHLAGEGIASGRWDAGRKRRIRASRVDGTRLLAGALAGLARRPGVLVSASAVGYYGNRGDERLTEESAPGADFLAETAVAWEAAAAPAAEAGIRVVHPRFAMILTPAGGALARMLPPFEAGLGGRLGDGRQWWSWVSLDDALGLVLHALATPGLVGPLNAAAPGEVTNRAFTEILGEVLGRPTLLPVPPVALRFAFGEMADALLLGGQRVVPARATGSGYDWRHPDLRGALRHLLGRG